MKRFAPLSYKALAMLLLGALLLLGGSGSAWAEIDTLSSAINKAGRQRMLTQRIVKAYCLVGMKVQSSRHKKQLKGALKLFESQLAELKVFAPSAEVADGLAKVEELWRPFKAVAAKPATREGAKKLLEMNDYVLAAAHAVVQLLEEQSTTGVGRLVNIAGRQRMLSQRLAKFYMARAWGIEQDGLQAQMVKAAGEFDTALKSELAPSMKNTPAIQAEINKAAKQWRLYERGLQLEQNSGDYIPVIMAVTSENLLKIMNTITGMYEKLSAS